MISLKVRPPILNREVLTFNEAHFGQALAKCISQKIESTRRRAIEESDDRHRRLLRPCRERPRGHRTEERDEVAPRHSITSSARASSVGGISRPSALALLRLITSS